MKAVVLFVFAALLATAAVSVRATEAEAEAEVDAEFNTHDADALEVDLSGADSNEMELETETTTEAELVDSEEEVDAAEEESDAEFEAEGEVEAETEGEAEAEAEGEAVATVEEGNFAAVQAKGCNPAVNSALMCPAGGSVFAKVQKKAPSNGCGPDGARILNDNLLGGKFTPCCNGHDQCYTGNTSGKAAKDACDTQFYECMKKTCGSNILCKGKAWIYYEAVSIKGCGAWEAAKKKVGC